MVVQLYSLGADEPEITNLQVVGYIIERDVEIGYNLAIPPAVVADINDLGLEYFIPPEIGSCLWSSYIQVTDFDPLLVSFGAGDPARYKFGSMVHQLIGTVTSHHYINYQNQAFPRQGTLVIPPTLIPIPFDESEVGGPNPAFRIYNTIQWGSTFAGVSFNLNDFGRENGGLIGSNEVRFDLAPSVVANITTMYFANIPINQTYSPGTYFLNF